MTNGYARMQQQAGAAGGKGGPTSCPGMILRLLFVFFHSYHVEYYYRRDCFYSPPFLSKQNFWVVIHFSTDDFSFVGVGTFPNYG